MVPASRPAGPTAIMAPGRWGAEPCTAATVMSQTRWPAVTACTAASQNVTVIVVLLQGHSNSKTARGSMPRAWGSAAGTRSRGSRHHRGSAAGSCPAKRKR